MSAPRLKSHLRVSALVRRAQAAGAFSCIVQRGDADAGAIAVKIYPGAGRAQLFVEIRDGAGDHQWQDVFDGETDEERVDKKLHQESAFDRDLWIIEIEDRQGRSFLFEND